MKGLNLERERKYIFLFEKIYKAISIIFLSSLIRYDTKEHFRFRNMLPKPDLSRSKRIMKISNHSFLFDTCSAFTRIRQNVYSIFPKRINIVVSF